MSENCEATAARPDNTTPIPPDVVANTSKSRMDIW